MAKARAISTHLSSRKRIKSSKAENPKTKNPKAKIPKVKIPKAKSLKAKNFKAKAQLTNRALTPNSKGADPIFAAIDKHRKLLKECDRLFAAIDRAENTLKKQNKKQNKKKKHHSVSSLRQQYEQTLRAERAAGIRMAKMKPKTLAGAAALIAYTRADMKLGLGPKWHMVALATIAAALAAMDTTEVS